MNHEERTLELLSLLRSGEATEHQIQELNKLLSQSPSLLELAKLENNMHASLSVVLEDEVSTERRLQNIITRVNEAEVNQFVSRIEQKLSKRHWRFPAAAIAAALVILSSLAFIYVSQPSSPAQNTMATLQRADGVKWVTSTISEGSALTAGASVKIEKGMLELDLAGCGRLIVEGPAHLHFTKLGHTILHQGRIVMRATEKGHGYRIDTPQGSIIDLGTEFGVTVGADGLVETHVIDGSIEAIPNGRKPVKLTRNDALRMSPSGGESITADSGQYYTLMPPKHQQKPRFIHWSFNENTGNLAHSEGELATTVANQAEMVFRATAQGSLPSWVPAPNSDLGTAIAFDGEGSYAESNYRGIGEGKPRTVCFWLKVPDDFSVWQGFGIVSWGKHSLPGEVWQLSVNPLKQDGPIGRLRLGLLGGQIIGSTDLRDAKWHHIAVVMYGGSQPNVGTHVILYVDGEQEHVSRRALQEVRTEINEAEHGVWLGRNSSYKGGPIRPRSGFFRGEIDELYIFDAALSQSELLGFIDQNR